MGIVCLITLLVQQAGVGSSHTKIFTYWSFFQSTHKAGDGCIFDRSSCKNQLYTATKKLRQVVWAVKRIKNYTILAFCFRPSFHNKGQYLFLKMFQVSICHSNRNIDFAARQICTLVAQGEQEQFSQGD